MNFNKIETDTITSDGLSPPAKLRMASKPSAGQIKGMAEHGRQNSERRRSEQARRIFRRRLGALAASSALAVGITANGGVNKTAHEVGNAAQEARDAVAARVAPSQTGHTYDQAELSGMKQRLVTVKPGEGADQVILDVKPNKQSDIFSDGPSLVAVEDYIEGQHPGPLQPGEQDKVPVLPHDG